MPRKSHSNQHHIQRDTCCICNQHFGINDPSELKYTHANGESIAMHYHHFVAAMSGAGTYLPAPPPGLSPRFDLAAYLNAAREILIAKPVRDIRAQRSIQTIFAFIDDAKLSRFLGGSAEFYGEGFYEQKAA